jgi:hypothetical protein
MAPVTGYRWWYMDVEAEDVTVVAILFDGFPFLPDRLDHGALQLDVYREGRRSVSVMALAPPGSDVGARLTDAPGQIDVQLEAWASLPGAVVKGSITVAGLPYEGSPVPGWWPLVPRGRGLVDLDVGGRRLTVDGIGYADHNTGDRPLHESLQRWVWARHHGDHSTTVLYEQVPREGRVAQGVLRDGRWSPAPVRSVGRQRRSAFGIAIPEAIETEGLRLELERPCLTAPFYVRVPTRPRGLAEIGRPGAINVPGLRHLVAMRPTGAGPDPPDKDRILHRAERRFLRRDMLK